MLTAPQFLDRLLAEKITFISGTPCSYLKPPLPPPFAGSSPG